MIDKTAMAGMESILAQIRNYEARTRQGVAPDVQTGPAAQPGIGGIGGLPTTAPAGQRESFPDLVKGAIDQVNSLQQDARKLTTAFERGEDVPLTDVVLAMHKSSVAFEATLQIRNKVMKAYEDIKNMPV